MRRKSSIARIVATLWLATACLGVLAGPAAAAASLNPVAAENARPGTELWQLGRPGFHTADPAQPQVAGYASATSVGAGDPLTLFVSLRTAQTYNVDVFRLGWYAGLGARQVRHLEGLDGRPQPACPADPQTGLIACAWRPGPTLFVRPDWTSGIYLALLTTADRYQSYIVFVVRDDGRPSDFLFQQPVATYQAYNNYPADGVSGKSLYRFNSRGPITLAGDPRAVKVSFDRPYALGSGAGPLFQWDLPLLRWLERSGYDVSYATDLDIHDDPTRLLHHRAFLSAGHDEYWSREMVNGVSAARDQGVDLAFFGADAAHWQVRLESSARGAPDRVEVCYRDRQLDPVEDPDLKTVEWGALWAQRSQPALLGVGPGAQVRTNAPLVIGSAPAWLLTGSGLRAGDRVAGIVGYEVDRANSNASLLPPASQSYAILADSPATTMNGDAVRALTTLYQTPGDAWVFASGTMSWSWALDRPGFVDPRIQRLTANLLDLFLDRLGPPPLPAPAPAEAAPAVGARVPAALGSARAPQPDVPVRADASSAPGLVQPPGDVAGVSQPPAAASAAADPAGGADAGPLVPGLGAPPPIGSESAPADGTAAPPADPAITPALTQPTTDPADPTNAAPMAALLDTGGPAVLGQPTGGAGAALADPPPLVLPGDSSSPTG